MRTDKTIFANESVTNIIVHSLISVIREIITLNESVNTNFNNYLSGNSRDPRSEKLPILRNPNVHIYVHGTVSGRMYISMHDIRRFCSEI